MKFSMGALLALVTIIGSILIGGANFGEVRGRMTEHASRIDSIEKRIEGLEENTFDMNKRTVQILTDLEWIKITLLEIKEEDRIKRQK